MRSGCWCQGDEDSIPLHIMLLLMDEVFDLKSRNQWLRRRIVAILQQIAKTMFGDSINRWVEISTGVWVPATTPVTCRWYYFWPSLQFNRHCLHICEPIAVKIGTKIQGREHGQPPAKEGVVFSVKCMVTLNPTYNIVLDYWRNLSFFHCLVILAGQQCGICCISDVFANDSAWKKWWTALEQS